MKILASLLIAIALTSGRASVGAKDPVRLDGTTEATFQASFAQLVNSLKTPERRTLALGLFGALLKHGCLAPEAVLHLTFMPVGPKDGRLIGACRKHLHGMTYPEILRAGEPPSRETASELPNNSFKPKPLRSGKNMAEKRAMF